MTLKHVTSTLLIYLSAPPVCCWCVLCGVVVCAVRALDSRLNRSRVRVPAVALSGNNLGQVVRIQVPLSPTSVIWYRSRGGDALQLGR